MSEVEGLDRCNCQCHSTAVPAMMHVAPCCAGRCPWCGDHINHGRMAPHVAAHEESQIRNLASLNCKAKHPDVHDALICVGPNESRFGPPCDECLDQERERYSQKRKKAFGELVSIAELPKELRERLGFD
jgi:hypothetical protein